MRPAKERFLNEIARHELAVLRDDGLYRHLRCQRPGTYVMGFDIITWPGYLAYTGDMGCYVFSRVQDMFEFFRGDNINPDYWGEKCQAVDRHSPIVEFTPEAYERALREFLQGIDDEEFARRALRDLLPAPRYEERETIHRTCTYDRRLASFYEMNCREFSFRFVWCCYAIVWAIKHYDVKATA